MGFCPSLRLKKVFSMNFKVKSMRKLLNDLYTNLSTFVGKIAASIDQNLQYSHNAHGMLRSVGRPGHLLQSHYRTIGALNGEPLPFHLPLYIIYWWYWASFSLSGTLMYSHAFENWRHRFSACDGRRFQQNIVNIFVLWTFFLAKLSNIVY
jgi:hypothetical protein